MKPLASLGFDFEDRPRVRYHFLSDRDGGNYFYYDKRVESRSILARDLCRGRDDGERIPLDLLFFSLDFLILCEESLKERL